MKHQRMKGLSASPVTAALAVIFSVIAIVIAVSVITNQAPTIATSSATSCGAGTGTSTENCTTSLQNAGITGSTLAGTVYSFGNVLWALGFLVAVGLVAAVVAKKMGVI